MSNPPMKVNERDPGFPERLRKIRENLEPKQTTHEIAAAAGVAQSTLSYYERGYLDPPIERRIKLAQALGVSPETLSPGIGREVLAQIRLHEKEISKLQETFALLS